MSKSKYRLEDFLTLVDTDCKGIVLAIHEMMGREGYKLKINLTKLYGLHVSYSQPKIKTVKGIIVYLLIKNGKLMIRINADNHANYPDVLNRLPQIVLNQMDKADDCVKMIDPRKCWKGCMGYDFRIGERHYQKCLITCFFFGLDSDTFPFLIDLIKSESKERCALYAQ